MNYSVIIISNRNITSIFPLIQSLQSQSKQTKEIIIVYDKTLTQYDRDKIFDLINHNFPPSISSRLKIINQIDHDLEIGRGVSYLRNIGIKASTSKILLLIDDDNTIHSDFMKDAISIYQKLDSKNIKHPLLVPTEYHNLKIRSRGYKNFSFMFGIPLSYHEENSFKIGGDYFGHIKFASSNCILGHRDIFISHPFPEDMGFVYEDFTMFASAYRDGVPIFVSHSLVINHHMRSKNILEDSYISTPYLAYQKGRNRLIFARTLGTSFQKIIYYILGLHIHTLALLSKIVIYAKGSDKTKLSIALLRGTLSGMFYSLK